MKGSAGTSLSGRTRWRRFAVLFVPAVGAVATVMALMVTGVVATPMVISGTAFTVSADSLNTNTTSDQSEFIQYGFVDSGKGVAVNVIKHAVLNNLDQVVCGATPAPGVSLKVEIKATSAVADNMVVDATSLTGDATFTNIAIGVQAPSGIPDSGAVGTFAQKADNASITTLKQQALFTSAGTFTLNGMSLTANLVGTGTNGC